MPDSFLTIDQIAEREGISHGSAHAALTSGLRKIRANHSERDFVRLVVLAHAVREIKTENRKAIQCSEL